MPATFPPSFLDRIGRIAARFAEVEYGSHEEFEGGYVELYDGEGFTFAWIDGEHVTFNSGRVDRLDSYRP